MHWLDTENTDKASSFRDQDEPLSSSFKPEHSVEYGIAAVFDNNEINILQSLFELEGLGISSVE